ncbi:cytochrome c3 family protein [Thermodesulfobacteriota bacterium]
MRVKAELVRLSRHPIKEDKMKCSDCHNSHGAIADKLIDAQINNQKCFECHADKRGPNLWDHMPVTENCITCHTPHGSSHSPLLKTKIPYLCQRCHSNDGHAGELWAKKSGQEGLTVYRASRNRLFYRSCVNCHSKIHGSNHPSGGKLLR